jgi:uncharacterized ferredoxin-like protein
MAFYSDDKLKQEGLLEAAKLASLSIHKAPSITGKREVKSLVVTGDSFMVMMDTVGAAVDKLGLGALMNFQFVPIVSDYFTFKVAMDTEGWDPTALLVGADLTTSDLGWDCGACGFPKCAEFNKYSRGHRSRGPLQAGLAFEGPSCMWKAIDYAVASDWAASMLYSLNVETRCMMTFGMIAHNLGYLEGTSVVIMMPLGPVVEHWYYSRSAIPRMLGVKAGALPEMMVNMIGGEFLRMRHPDLWTSLPALAHPWIKKEKYWESSRDYVSLGPNPDLDSAMAEVDAALREAIEEKKKELEVLKQKQLPT